MTHMPAEAEVSYHQAREPLGGPGGSSRPEPAGPDAGRGRGVRPDRGVVGVAASRAEDAGRHRRRRGRAGRARRPGGGQHGFPARGQALPPGLGRPRRRRAQGRGPQPGRRRGHGRRAVRPAGRPGGAAGPAGELGPRASRGAGRRVRPGGRERDRRRHRPRRPGGAGRDQPRRPGRPGPGAPATWSRWRARSATPRPAWPC